MVVLKPWPCTGSSTVSLGFVDRIWSVAQLGLKLGILLPHLPSPGITVYSATPWTPGCDLVYAVKMLG